jgi:hypothetical protein
MFLKKECRLNILNLLKWSSKNTERTSSTIISC